MEWHPKFPLGPAGAEYAHNIEHQQWCYFVSDRHPSKCVPSRRWPNFLLLWPFYIPRNFLQETPDSHATFCFCYSRNEKDRNGWWPKIAIPLESDKNICWQSGNQISLVPEGKKKQNKTKKQQKNPTTINKNKNTVGGVHGTKKGCPWMSASG